MSEELTVEAFGPPPNLSCQCAMSRLTSPWDHLALCNARLSSAHEEALAVVHLAEALREEGRHEEAAAAFRAAADRRREMALAKHHMMLLHESALLSGPDSNATRDRFFLEGDFMAGMARLLRAQLAGDRDGAVQAATELLAKLEPADPVGAQP